ncbi:MAG TPA: DUF5941 domain-containing protein [Thermoleophilaceae bacterium]|jgi:hypothetical protein
MTRAIVFATAPAADGGVAAALRFEDGTPLERLLGQLASDGVSTTHVITRPALAAAMASLLSSEGVRVHPSADRADDLRAVAAIARGEGAEGLVLLGGELVTQPAVLDRLGAGTAALTLGKRPDDPAFPLRALRGRVRAAASPYHWVGTTSGFFGNVLRVDPADVPALAAAAERLAGLVSEPLPEGWPEELERKQLEPAAAEDVLALLVTALVRDGTVVAARDARALFWARPSSKARSEQAAGELTGFDEEKARLAAAVKSADGFFTTFFVSPYSRYVARFAARLGLTPNQVTVLSMCVGIVAAAAFATGKRWGLVGGALVLQVAFMLDCVDGQLARYTRSFSRFGAWLDSVFDRLKEYLVYAGLAIGSTRGFGVDVWALAAGALSLQTIRHMLEFSYWDVHYAALESVPQPPLEQPGDRPGAPPGGLATVARAPAAVHDTDSLASRALGLSRLLDRPPGVHWLKKMIVFPIGERFAVISLTAALFTPRTTFIVLLVWGGVGGVYSLAAHLTHTIARRAAVPESAAAFLAALRDDGLLARAAAARIHARSRFDWLVPGVVRALEYGLLLLTALLAHGHATRACFALLAVLAFHHYDTVYRLRQQGAPPPAWVSVAGGGWDGRIILAWIALLVAVTTAGMAVAAVLLALLFGGESVSSWTRAARADQPLTYADEEDDNE